jgi:hypothetical protein
VAQRVVVFELEGSGRVVFNNNDEIPVMLEPLVQKLMNAMFPNGRDDEDVLHPLR